MSTEYAYELRLTLRGDTPTEVINCLNSLLPRGKTLPVEEYRNAGLNFDLQNTFLFRDPGGAFDHHRGGIVVYLPLHQRWYVQIAGGSKQPPEVLEELLQWLSAFDPQPFTNAHELVKPYVARCVDSESFSELTEAEENGESLHFMLDRLEERGLAKDHYYGYQPDALAFSSLYDIVMPIAPEAFETGQMQPLPPIRRGLLTPMPNRDNRYLDADLVWDRKRYSEYLSALEQSDHRDVDAQRATIERFRFDPCYTPLLGVDMELLSHDVHGTEVAHFKRGDYSAYVMAKMFVYLDPMLPQMIAMRWWCAGEPREVLYIPDDTEGMRQYTPKEIERQFIEHVSGLVDHWSQTDFSSAPSLVARSGNEATARCDGLAFSILAALDGSSMGVPAFVVAPTTHETDQSFNVRHGENWYPSNHDVEINADIGGGLHDAYSQFRRQKHSQERNAPGITALSPPHLSEDQ